MLAYIFYLVFLLVLALYGQVNINITYLKIDLILR